MDKFDHARKAQLMNMKENVYIYAYKDNSKLIYDNKAEENNNKNILFDIALSICSS
jgi:hypothetical protein